MSFIKFEDVTREFKSGDNVIKALDGISFEIETGKFTVILGPSGSGKSTTLNLLGGMDRATSGNIQVGKRNVTSLNNKELTVYRRHDIGFVFQFYNLIPSLTALENVDMVCKLSHSPLAPKETLDLVGLSHRLDSFPAQMSGGELQRVSIARALCKNPKILLCDEPTGALDSDTGKKVLILLQQMSKKYNKAVIVVTHNAAIAPAADRLIRLKDGKIVEVSDNKNPMKMKDIVW